jgi:hypothetical protein
MIPIFMPPSDSEDGRNDVRRRKMLGVGLGAAIALAVGLVLLSPRTGAVIGLPVWGILSLVIVVLVVVGVFAANRESSAQKRKRGLDGLDMYTLIDRMVDDLDEDELAYLRRRLERKDNDLPDKMADLLDQREQERQAKRR